MKTESLDCPASDAPTEGDFARRMTGKLYGILRWQDLDALWVAVRAQPTGWYASLVGDSPPESPLDAETLHRLIDEIDTLLRKEHDEDYCGIVYVDDPAQPALIKIYDPNNLGTSCGCGSIQYPPRWVLSRDKPTGIEDATPLPGGRRRWWQRLFG